MVPDSAPSPDTVTKDPMAILTEFGVGAGLIGTASSAAQAAQAAPTTFGTVGTAAFGVVSAGVGGALVGTAMDHTFTALAGQHLGAAIYDWTHGVED